MKRTVLAALAATFLMPGIAPAQDQTRHDCGHLYSQPYYRAVAKQEIRHKRRLEHRALYRLASMRYCARSDEAQAGMLRSTKRLFAQRRAWLEGIYWRDRFAAFSPSDRNWANATGECESHNNPNANGHFKGAFQFLVGTWNNAQATLPAGRRRYGNPAGLPWFQQAVVAVLWMHRAGNGQWPVCGH